MVDVNAGPSFAEIARLSEMRRSGDEDEADVDGIDESVDSESDDSDVKEDEDEDSDEREELLAVEFGGESIAIRYLSLRTSSGSLPNNAF
jgi:hypothetical protein